MTELTFSKANGITEMKPIEGYKRKVKILLKGASKENYDPDLKYRLRYVVQIIQEDKLTRRKGAPDDYDI